MTDPFVPSRRSLLGGAAAAGLAALLPARAARAELTIDLRGGNFRPMPIAVFDFEGEQAAAAQAGSVITNNLRRSGLFAPLDKANFPEKAIGFDSQPKFEAWGPSGVQAIVTGRVMREGGRVRAQFRLWDVAARAQLVGQEYAADAAGWRRIAHQASDAVFERITGEKGFFDTRIVFIDESGPKQARRKRLAVMDQDGANYRLIGGGDLVVTPRFSPSSQQITYMAFGEENPRVFLLDVVTGQRQQVGNYAGMSFAPRFSPDGRRVVMSLQEGGNANIYAMDLGSRQQVRLTSSAAIDTSPSYAPDGSQIVFESDRGGGQQLYVMGAGGGEARRISFGEGRYSTPVWSPKGDFIAFTKQRAGSFAIGIMRPDGSGERVLTEGFHNEGPTWAPNGRYLMFFRDPGGNAGPKLVMIDTTGRVEVPVPTPNYASDPAWSPLLSDLR